MPPKNRKELLQEACSRLDIPQIVFPYQLKAEQVIGPYDPDFFRRHRERREEREAEAIAALKAMSDLELLHLLSEEEDLFGFASEHGLGERPPWYAAGFAVRAIEDFRDWCKYEYWTLHEAVCLSVGFPPQDLPYPPELFSQGPSDPPMEFYWQRHETLKRALDVIGGNGIFTVRPKSFARWASEIDLEVPVALLDCLNGGRKIASPAMLRTVDARRLDSAQKVILGLVADARGDSDRVITDLAMAEAVTYVQRGLGILGLAMDRKTVKKTLSDARRELGRFEAEQSKRDEHGE